MSLPQTQKALVLGSLKDPMDLTLQTIPMPTLSPGSAIVRVLAARVIKEASHMFTGKLPYPMPVPFVPGIGAVVRVEAVGPDAVALQPGQLALFDATVHARDDPSSTAIIGFFGAGPSKKLIEGEWRNSSYAEYLKAPLENIYPLDEEVLINRLGYKIPDLVRFHYLLVPYGGLAGIGLKPGESIVIAPATGSFSSSAVLVALGMGARVIAAGRNEEKLKSLLEHHGSHYGNRLTYVQLSGDAEKDTAALLKASPSGKGLDCFLDLSPRVAANSTHIKACLMALKTYGRASLMGGINEDISIPYFPVMLKNLHLSGRFMYEPHQVRELISILEAGLIKLGPEVGLEVVGGYKLEDADAAFEIAAKNQGFGKEFVFEP